MKKVFPFMLLLATVFAFSACSSDDDEPDTGIIENIIGTWDATSVKVDNEWFDITNYPNLAMSITFDSDGSYYGRGALGNGGGTYSISGKTIKTYIDGELYGTYVVKSISSKYAELSLTIDGENMDIRAKKR